MAPTTSTANGSGLFGKITIPMLVTVITMFGTQIIWPSQRFDSLSSQGNGLSLEIDSTNFRIDSLSLRLSEQELRNSADLTEINRRLRTISILACSAQNKNSLVYSLADCATVLAPNRE